MKANQFGVNLKKTGTQGYHKNIPSPRQSTNHLSTSVADNKSSSHAAVNNSFQHGKNSPFFPVVKKNALFTDDQPTNKILARNFLSHQLSRNRSVGQKLFVQSPVSSIHSQHQNTTDVVSKDLHKIDVSLNNQDHAGNSKRTSSIGPSNVKFEVDSIKLNGNNNESVVRRNEIDQTAVLIKPIRKVEREEQLHVSSQEASKNGHVPVILKSTVSQLCSTPKTSHEVPVSKVHLKAVNRTVNNLEKNGLTNDSKISIKSCYSNNKDNSSISIIKPQPSVKGASVTTGYKIKNEQHQYAIGTASGKNNQCKVTVEQKNEIKEKKLPINHEEKTIGKDTSKQDSANICAGDIESFQTINLPSSLETEQPGVSFTKELEDQAVTEGSTLRLTAHVNPASNQKIEWSKDGKVIKSSAHTRFSVKDDVCTLSIQNVTLQHDGEYMCTVKNDTAETSTSCNVTVEKKPSPPIFKKKLLPSVNVIEGERIEFLVKVEGSPPPAVEWFHHNKEVLEAHSVHIFSLEESQFRLVLDCCKVEDKGRIKCVAKNKAGSATSYAELNVKPAPPKLKLVTDSTVSVEANKDACFQIEIPSDGAKYKVDWFKGSRGIFRETKKYEMQKKDIICSFIVKDVQETDGGNYKCVVTGPGGKVTQEFQLTLKEPEVSPPAILEHTSQDFECVEGGVINLDVKVSGYPLPSVTWYKGENLLKDGGSVKLTSKKEQHTLTIKNAVPSDTGDYNCVVDNGHGVNDKVFSVVVNRKDSKPVFQEKLSNVTVDAHKEAEFCVVVEGVPEPKVEWKLNDVLLSDDGRFQILTENYNNHVLIIDDCKVEDSGSLVCTASNQAGVASCTAKLIINKPKAPLSDAKKISKKEVATKDTPHKKLVRNPPPKEKHVEKGGTLQLEVELWKEGDFDVIWEKGGELLEESNDVIFERDGCIHRLKMLNVQSDDEGDFEAFIINEEDEEEIYFCKIYVDAASPPAKPEKMIESAAKKTDISSNVNAVPLKPPKPAPKLKKEKLISDEKKIVPVASEGLEASVDDHLFAVDVKLKPVVTQCEDEAKFFVVLTNVADEYFWSIDGDELTPETDGYNIFNEDNKYTLVIQDCCQEDDKSLIKFTASFQNTEVTSSAKLTVQPQIPALKEKVDLHQERFSGDDIELLVQVKGHKNPKVQWNKGFKVLSHLPNKYVMKTDGNLVSLTLKNATTAESGIYKCAVKSDSGSSELKFNIKIKAKRMENVRPVISPRFEDMTFELGEKIALEANITGQPNPEVKWYKDGTLIRSTSNIKLTHEKTTYILTIYKASAHDSGDYKIVAKNSTASTSFSAEVRTSPKSMLPVFVRELKNKEVDDRESVLFEVEVKDSETVTWYYENEEISDDEDFEFISEGNYHSFEILSVNPEDSGKYECKVSNKNGSISSMCTLKVNELLDQIDSAVEEPVIIAELEDDFVEKKEGEDFVLKFHAKGSPLPAVHLYKDDQLIKSSGNVSITSKGDEHTLTIKKLKEEDSGFYLLEAENDNGLVEKEIELVVEANPAQPPAVKPKVQPPTVKPKVQLPEIKSKTQPPEVKSKTQPPEVKSKTQPPEVKSKTQPPEVKSKTQPLEIKSKTQPPEVKSKTQPPEIKSKIQPPDVKSKTQPPEVKSKTQPTEVKSKTQTPEIKSKPQSPDIKSKPQSPEIKSKPQSSEIKAQPPEEKLKTQPPEVKPKNKPLELKTSEKNTTVTKQKPAVKLSPTFVTTLQDVEVVEMSAARFDVLVEGDLDIEFTWFKNGVEIVESREYRIEEDDYESSLIIVEVGSSDRGKYECVAKNIHGSASTYAELFVELHGFESGDSESELGGRSITRTSSVDENLSDDMTEVEDELEEPQLILPLRDKKANVGDKVRFSCRAQSITSDTNICWYFNDAIVSDKDTRTSVSVEGELFTFEISNVRVSDSGEYKIVFQTSPKQLESSAELYVEDMERVETVLTTEKSLKSQPKTPSVQAKPLAVQPPPKAAPPKAAPKPAAKPTKSKNTSSEVFVEEELISETVGISLEEAPVMRFDHALDDPLDTEISKITDRDVAMKLLEIKEIHPALDREVTRHKFPGGTGIDVVVMPATPRDSPVTGSKPKILKKPDDLDLCVGDTAEFELIVEDGSDVCVSWTKDGEILLNSGRINIWNKGSSYWMKITNLQASDEALYEYCVRNESGKVMDDVELLVDGGDEVEEVDGKDAIKIVKALKKEYIVIDGEELLLEVETEGQPPPTVSWYFGDQKLRSSEEIEIVSKGNKHQLHIPETVLDDEGSYKCVVNAGSRSIETETEVFIDEVSSDTNADSDGLPSIIKPLADTECFVGDKILLEVEIKNCAEARWYLNDNQLKNGPSVCILDDKNTFTLHFDQVSPDEDGEVKVVASNQHGVVETSCALFVQELSDKQTKLKSQQSTTPPRFSSRLVSRQVKEGDIVRLDTRVKTESPVTVQWKYQENLITPAKFPNITVLSDDDLYSLIIPEATLSDTGLYSCSIQNEFGEDSCSSNLLILPHASSNVSSDQPSLEEKRRSTGMHRLEEVLALHSYVVTKDVDPLNSESLKLKKGDTVEILDCSRHDLWLVRRSSDTSSIGFVTPNVLEKVSSRMVDQVVLETIIDESISLDHEEERKGQCYVAIGNFDPKSNREIALKEGTTVELIQGEPNQEHWVVRIINSDGSYGNEGVVPSTYLELRTEDENKKDDFEESVDKNGNHRLKVLKEIVDTEEKYVEQLKAVTQSHLVEMEEADDLPPAMDQKQDVIFSNIKEIFSFHSKIFLSEMRDAQKNHESMAKCFIQHAEKLEPLYVDYCSGRPAADEILDKPEVMEFWDIFQQDTDDPHPLRGYLITPVQRITRYQLLLKELLKYTTRLNENSDSIELALSQIHAITRLANDTMHFKRIVGFEGNLSIPKCGKVLRMDSLLCWDGSKGKGKGKDRHLFLCENLLIGVKKIDTNKKDDISYAYKFSIKSSDLGQTENIEGYPNRWVIWQGKSASTATQVFTLEAKSEAEKSDWVVNIREILAKQLTELKNSALIKRQSSVMDTTGYKTITVNKAIKSETETGEEEVATLTEKIGTDESYVDRGEQYASDLHDIEEAYLAAEYQEKNVAITHKVSLEVGKLYRIKAETKTKGTCKTILKQNDLVSLVKQGSSLYLVEPAGSDDPSKRTWVPGSYLLPLTDDQDEDEEEDPPIIIEELSPIVAAKGTNVSFRCRLVNADKIEWFYEDLQITAAEGVEFTFKHGVAELRLENICLSDEGSYSMKASNSVGVVEATAQLKILVPAKFTELIKAVSVSQYDDASFKCEFEAHPSPDVKWYHNDVEVIDQGKFIIESSETLSILDIADVHVENAGEYKCVISNNAGKDECAAMLSVTCPEKPESPGTPTVTKVTDKSVTLTWSASPAASFYIVEKRHIDDRNDAWKTANEQVEGESCIIDGLNNGDEIYFRVIAVHDDMLSEPSTSIKVLIEAPRRKKTKKKTTKNDDSCSDTEIENISSKNKLSVSPKIEHSGRLSPFSQIRNRSADDHSSSDDGEAIGKGKFRSRSKSPGPLYSSTRKGRARSKSPMRIPKSPSSQEIVNGEVPFGPPFFTRELENCFVVEGGAARFTCRVCANPEAEVNWFKDNEKLQECKQFTMLFDADENCVLIITQSNHDTAGSYTCVASNSEGTIKSSAILFVEGLQTEYDSETEDEVSDPEPLPDKEDVLIKKEDVESYYVLKEELGRGKFGVVTKCADKLTNIEYAAKFIKCRPSERKNVTNEIEIMNSLNHKRLINLVAAFESSRQIVLVLELVTGGELFEKLTEEEFISEKDVTFYMKQVLQGVQHMHEHDVLHLDLKPENIMLVNQRSTQIKLIDFGLARRYKKGDLLKVLFGTPEFMAPEVINYEQVTPATDMWSIGVITYVLLSGLSPFAGDNDSETLTNVTSGEWDFDDPVFEDISDEAKDFIQDLLVKKGKDRASVKECLEHPWFTSKIFKKKIRTDRLKAFTARRKWKKAITAVRSTNFLTRLLTGIKTVQAETAKKQEEKNTQVSSSNTGPSWKKAEDIEDEDDLAPMFKTKVQDIKIKKGEVAHFKAEFERNDEEIPIITWKREGKEIVESKRIHSSVIENVIHFKVLNCNLADTGRYTARLENQHGSTECSAQLIVRDVPGAPAAPTVPQVLSTSALVQWRAGFDGNSPIMSYQLQYRKLGDKEWSVFADEIKELVAVVEDLEPLSSYRFRVSARNEVGTGDMSEATGLIQTPEKNEKDNRNSIDAPGARRVSRSSSIRVPIEIKVKPKVDEIKLKEENPENTYNFKNEIGRGKFAVVKKCASKITGDTYAAKLVKYDEDTMDITKKEFEIWKDLSHDNIVALHDAYLVRKYLVLICDLVTGEHVLNFLSNVETLTENDVANCIRQLLAALDYLHQCDLCHLDVKPGNMIMRGETLKLIDYGCARKVATRGGEVGEIVGTAEFMAPETINFEPVSVHTDIWSVGVVTYALLSGISPFASDDEDETMANITALDYRFEASAFASITEEAKQFVRSLIIRIPEKRPSADICLEDPWLSDRFMNERLASHLNPEALLDLAEVLEEQDNLENVHASLVLRTFLQSPYDSPESDTPSDDENVGLA